MTLFEFMKTDTFNEKNAAQLFMIITTDILKKRFVYSLIMMT